MAPDRTALDPHVGRRGGLRHLAYINLFALDQLVCAISIGAMPDR